MNEHRGSLWITLIAGLFLSGVVFADATLDPTHPLAATNHTFVNQKGKPFALFDLKGKPLFVVFVYSHCPVPTMCPLTLTLTHQLVETLKQKKMANRLRVLIVTLDPAHDSPSVLKDLGKRHRLDLRYVTLATGAPRSLDDFELEMRVAKVQEGQFVAHSTRAVLLDGDLSPIAYFDDNKWAPENVIQALPPLKHTVAQRYGANK